jgi:glycosyltransferase involved in cell wall biosynthesis
VAKVIFLTTALGTGGPTQVVLTQARALQRCGLEVAVWGLSPAAPGWEPPDDLSFRSLDLHKASGMRGTSRRLTEALAEERPDVLHLHSFSPHVHGVRAAMALDLPAVVVSFHDFRLGWRRALTCRKLADRVDRVVVLNHAMADLYRRMGGYTPAQMVVLPNGVEVARFAPRPRDEELARQVGLTPDDWVLGCVGTFYPNKGHRFLLEALAAVRSELPRARLILVGAGRQRRALETLSRRLRLGAGVIFAGEQQDIPRWMSLFDLYVQPSILEAHGLALNEAMAMALPCVATDRGGMPELLAHGDAGVVVPSADAGALAQAILALARDPERARALGAAARRRAGDYYSMQQYEERLGAMYRELLDLEEP